MMDYIEVAMNNCTNVDGKLLQTHIYTDNNNNNNNFNVDDNLSVVHQEYLTAVYHLAGICCANVSSIWITLWTLPVRDEDLNSEFSIFQNQLVIIDPKMWR